MNRKVLLIEPNYKNKYPPMGLMKLATYFRKLEDDVRFYKGDLKEYAADLLYEDFIKEVGNVGLTKYSKKIIDYLRIGKYNYLDEIPDFRGSQLEEKLNLYRIRYKEKNYPKFDIVGVSTLFTFYWNKTIETINYSKYFCKDDGRILIGGIASTILPNEIEKETGIKPYIGLLNKKGIIDKNNEYIIDELPLDYSILDEIDYEYPAKDSYFGYMTRGCVNNCKFCAVPKLEPIYRNYIALKNQIEEIEKSYGARKDLLLMDNNVFASDCFGDIIDEIKGCGFERNSQYIASDEYDITMKNLKTGVNNRAYKKKIIKIYNQLSEKMTDDEAGDIYSQREKLNLLYSETIILENVMVFDRTFRPLYEKLVTNRKRPRSRYIDFNQGVDARLVTEEKMKKLAEINIRPLRIAFDHYSMKNTYIEAVKIAVKYGITNLSNYLLYNFEDKPEELYYRMKINIELCEELNVTIYSFPMKYHPIDDPEYFRNRNYIGKHWNRKFIRSIQAVLNATKGKIGRNRTFFEEAFGKDIDEFNKILWMPEEFIIYRRKYNEKLRSKLEETYQNHYDDENNFMNEWWNKFNSLDEKRLEGVKEIIAKNKFSDEDLKICEDDLVREVLEYYRIKG